MVRQLAERLMAAIRAVVLKRVGEGPLSVGGKAGKLFFREIRQRLWIALICAFALSAIVNILMLTTPIYMMQVFDRVMTGRHEETLVALTVIALAAYVAYGVVEFARKRIMANAGAWLERSMAGATLDAGLQSTLEGRPVGGQGMRDLTQLRGFFGGQALFPFLDAPWALSFFIILWVLNIWMGVYAVVAAVVISALAIAGERAARTPQKRHAEQQIGLNLWLEQAVSQAEAVLALGMRPHLVKRASEKLHTVQKDNMTAQRRAEIFASTARATRQVAQVGIMALAAGLLLQGELSPGLVIGGSILMARALAPIDMLISSWSGLVSGFGAYTRLKKTFETYAGNEEKTVPPTPKAVLQVRNAHKRLPDSGTAFLFKGVSLDMAGGELLCVVGPSGAGKSSLCKALSGVMPPDIGEVRLDDARLDQWPIDALGQHLGYLPQDVGVPPATVAETIARLSETPDMERVYAAARMADAHEMIMKLPKGYDTPIGGGGLPLSGGQRQRIGLARALFGAPVMVILDEPDAHLDTDGTAALVGAIQAVKSRGAMVVLVSHRPPILRIADKIMVMREGSVVHFGTRDEILPILTGKPAAAPEGGAVRKSVPVQA